MTGLFNWSCFNSTNYYNVCAVMFWRGGLIDSLGGLWAIQAGIVPHTFDQRCCCLPDSAGLCCRGAERGGPSC